METYQVRLPSGKVVSKQLAPGLSDADVQAAFLPDYKKAGFKATGPVQRPTFQQSIEDHWRRQLGDQGSISNATPTLGERFQGWLGKGLTAAGMEGRDAYRMAGKAFAPFNDLTPVGNLTGMDEGARMARAGVTRGDLAQLGLGAGVFALSALPGGAAAKKFGKGMFGRLLKDESGAIRAYHGTPWPEFDKFDREAIGNNYGGFAHVGGFHFTSDKARARSYADFDEIGFPRDHGRVITADLNIQNPHIVPMPGAQNDLIGALDRNPDWLRQAERKHDGLEVRSTTGGGSTYVVFDPSLIDIVKQREPIRAFHGTLAGELGEFRPGTHFGSRGAAEQRLREMTEMPDDVRPIGAVRGLGQPRVHEVDLEPRKLFDIGDDMGEWHPEDMVARLKAKGIDYSGDDPFGHLQSLGYDAVVYRNLWEDAGSKSYIALDPKIIRKR